MNIFIAIMLVFCGSRALDEILGGKLGLMPNFEKGLPRWGSSDVHGRILCDRSYICRRTRKRLRRQRQSICHLIRRSFQRLTAPDMGALGMAQKLAATPALAAFTGAMVAGSLGMTVGYQLPVFLAAVRKDEIGELMRGFIFESIAIPSGLAVGGPMLGLPVRQLFFNMIPVLVLCMVLIAAFVLVPALTMKIMIFLGNGSVFLVFSCLVWQSSEFSCRSMRLSRMP